jgi:predicted MFS family arabinose efflux permease
MIVAILSTAAYSVLFPTITPLAGDWYHWTEWEVGIALSVFGFIGALVQGGLIRPMSRRLGNKITAIVGLVLTAAGLAWVASHPLDTAGFWAALSILAVGTGLSVPTITAMMSLSVNERDQGTVHGLNQSATSIGRSAGFLASGFIFESVSRAATYQVGAAAAAVSLLILLMIPEPARTDKQAAAGEAAMDESQV